MDETLLKYGNEEGVRQTLSRLIGRHWQEARKFGETTDQSEELRLFSDEET